MPDPVQAVSIHMKQGLLDRYYGGLMESAFLLVTSSRCHGSEGSYIFRWARTGYTGCGVSPEAWNIGRSTVQVWGAPPLCVASTLDDAEGPFRFRAGEHMNCIYLSC